MNFSHSSFKPETSATYTFLMRYGFVLLFDIKIRHVYALWLINGSEVDPVSMVTDALYKRKCKN